MSSPIVCVAKRDGGVRIAVDYRYLNSYTVGDAYPMATIDDVLCKIIIIIRPIIIIISLIIMTEGCYRTM